MVNELSTLSIRKLRKRRQKVAQTLQNLKQAKYYASLQNHPDVSYPIMSCKSEDDEKRRHAQAYLRPPKDGSQLQLDEAPRANMNAQELILHYFHWRKIRLLELEILRLMRVVLTDRCQRVIEDQIRREGDWDLSNVDEIPDLANDRLKVIIGEDGPVESHGFDTYLTFLEHNLAGDNMAYFFNSLYMNPYTQNRQHWDFALLRRILVDRQFQGVAIPSHYRLGQPGNSNFTQEFFNSYIDFFTNQTNNGPNYSHTLATLGSERIRSSVHSRRWNKIVRKLRKTNSRSSRAAIEEIIEEDYPNHPELDLDTYADQI